MPQRTRPKDTHLRTTAEGLALALLLCALPSSARPGGGVTGGPRGTHPYLFDGFSKKRLVSSRPAHSWSLLGHRHRGGDPDRLHIIAMMIEFNNGRPDTSDLTTGNGLFGINKGGGTSGDQEEKGFYNADTVYPYDDLPHYHDYFRSQLAFVKNYFGTVSRGRLSISYDIYPKADQAAYTVDSTMVKYSPGGKKKKESWDEYYFRKTRGLMAFVRDAVRAAGSMRGPEGKTHASYGSPFDDVEKTADGKFVIVDSTGRETPAAFLIIHAGASYLTDGGVDGAFGRDTPSDMIDAFVSEDFFSYYRDTLSLDTLGGKTGVLTQNGVGTRLLVDELMMVSETSNQDGLNWGIHGILVNQVARQLGIPDLFSTSSGISGIGAFCIMDFAGYSAAQGFIPPWPSAWVRAFMGWDEPVVARIGASANYHIKALGTADSSGADTTIVLVPINDHEYYLIENRQRDPDNAGNLFTYDTTEDDNTPYIAPYPYNLELDSNVVQTSNDGSDAILQVVNLDAGLPASGVVVWHVDEEVLRARLEGNMVNADSLYRGVSLVEADGVTDLGILFQDVFYQAAFDYGGAEDIFPHTTDNDDTTFSVTGFTPYTRPSTRSNDGGHTYLSIRVNKTRGLSGLRTERYAIRDYLVTNYADSVYQISVEWEYLSPTWPRRMAPDSIHEPVVLELFGGGARELAALSTSGRLYVWSPDTASFHSLGRNVSTFPQVNLRGDTVTDTSGQAVLDTCWYLADLPAPAGMPTTIGNALFVPAADKALHILDSITAAGTARWDTVALSHAPSTYVCNYEGDAWAVGCGDGIVLFGAGRRIADSVALGGGSAVTALAALSDGSSRVAAIQADGKLSICAAGTQSPDTSVTITSGLPPYTLAAGDLDNNDGGESEIVVCDSRQGLWLYNADLSVAAGWEEEPNDIASAYSVAEENDRDNRSLLPFNASPPTLADIDDDGYPEILIGGTNGIYAFNYKSALVDNWPAYLDNRYWLQRGSVRESPSIGSDLDGKPVVLFSSPSGDNVTFRITRIDSADATNTKVYYTREDGTRDSIWDLGSDLVDSIVGFNDSLIAPYVLPGGYIDAIGPDARRPNCEVDSLPTVGNNLFCHWPVTTGSPLMAAPLLCNMDSDSLTDLVGISRTGWAYRWEIPKEIVALDSTLWAQTGFNQGRTFAYRGAGAATLENGGKPIEFFSFPNPARGVPAVYFKYKFSGPATDVRIDVFSYTGYHIYTWKEPTEITAVNYPGWNRQPRKGLSLKNLGPGVYRCRIQATVRGKEHTRYWKMAVMK